ncbi:hypothetical protein BC833DRAFT_568363 [Globomyces pollinis-pini]|nr:hypothetical protein BC833DRAFT_568363 [Globomyces pollinis-pini]
MQFQSIFCQTLRSSLSYVKRPVLREELLCDIRVYTFQPLKTANCFFHAQCVESTLAYQKAIQMLATPKTLLDLVVTMWTNQTLTIVQMICQRVLYIRSNKTSLDEYNLFSVICCGIWLVMCGRGEEY